MKWMVIVVVIIFGCLGLWYWNTVDNAGTKITTTPKTVGVGEYTTVLGKLRKNIWGKYTVGNGYSFEPSERVYWSCIDKSKSRTLILDIGDYVNSFMYYKRESRDYPPLLALLETQSRRGGWVQITGELNKNKHLFISTKVILFHDCP